MSKVGSIEVYTTVSENDRPRHQMTRKWPWIPEMTESQDTQWELVYSKSDGPADVDAGDTNEAELFDAKICHARAVAISRGNWSYLGCVTWRDLYKSSEFAWQKLLFQYYD